MNISRGLFRLWLVLSLFWAASVGVITYQTLPPELPDAPWVKPTSDYLSKLSDDELKALYAKTTGKPAFDPSKPYTVLPLGFVLDDPRRDAIKAAVAQATIVPGIVLLVGASLVWAVRGFRPSP
ncbi:hypothetical protein ACQR2B_30995 [Bradyrhizobium oligotrophicum]|uniref:hypothetical protein n=1 Tax=Bradyrhizobium TaxID=374 RepID=UPI003EB86EB8